MMTGSRQSAGMLVVLCSLLLGTAALAGEPPQLAGSGSASTEDLELAEKHFSEGVKLFQAEKFELARIEFLASYELCHRPDLLHNLSFVAERQNRRKDAIELEERFLAEMKKFPAQYTLEDQQKTEERIARLRQGDQPASVPQPEQPARSRPPTGAISLMGIGGGLLAVGIGCGIGALTAAHAINSGMVASSDRQMAIDRGQAMNTSAIVFDVVGGGTLAAGAIWAIVHRVKGRR